MYAGYKIAMDDDYIFVTGPAKTGHVGK